MKKLGLGILIAVTVLVISGIVIAQGPGGIVRYPAEVIPSEFENLIKVPEQAIDSSPVIKRVFLDSTSPLKISILKVMGCSVVHQLQDATALKCPTSVASLFNLREDRVFYPIDLDADVQIKANLVWADGIDGTGVNVAVLDTGIDADHPEIADSYLGGYDYFYNDAIPEDDYGHGTHVAGIITANGVGGATTTAGYLSKGVAPGAGIYMYKVCGPIGAGYGCYESDMMAAMEAAVLTDAKVMSISIGGGNYKDENCDDDELAAKVNWVVGEGITAVVAAGNDQFFVSSPACASGAIAVGAVDKTGLMASWSNFGPALDIVAPGVSIYSSIIDGYDSWSGTSMSAPHVAGTVALILEANFDLGVNDIKTALYETADPIAEGSICYGVVKQKGRVYWIGVVDCSSDNYGAGIVNALGAVNYVPCVPTTEVCDGIDNDCDGLIDEDLGQTTCGIGACQVTVDNCVDGVSQTCTPGTATAEICDGIDNDCDGEIDEGCASVTVCGDGYCAGADLGEDCRTCSTDCPSGAKGVCCGDGKCDTRKGETAEMCPVDCGL